MMMGKVVVYDSDRDTTGFPLLVVDVGGGSMANVGDGENESTSLFQCNNNKEHAAISVQSYSQ